MGIRDSKGGPPLSDSIAHSARRTVTSRASTAVGWALSAPTNAAAIASLPSGGDAEPPLRLRVVIRSVHVDQACVVAFDVTHLPVM